MKTLAICGTFDSKADEYLYIKDIAEQLGLKTYMIHTGVFEPKFTPDVSNVDVAKEAGYDIAEIAKKKDRALGTEALASGMEKIVPRLYKEGRFDGILSLGGSGGTSLATPAMRALPVGVPKIMVSTMASGNVEQYVGTSDIMMIPSIVDVAGLNEISRTIFKNAVMAAAGMLEFKDRIKESVGAKRPTIGATMFGVTTPCVTKAKEYLEGKGYDVVVFHATGTGGRCFESLVEAGFFDGVLDVTTTEWCDELFGGVLSAGEHRSEAASKMGIPQVVSVGAMDMVNFGPIDTVPAEHKGRNLYKHNPTVTLMRTTAAECKKLGQKLAEKLNLAKKKTALFLPLKGVSMIAVEGQPFYDAEADKELFDALRSGIKNPGVEIVELDTDVNDDAFAVAMADKLISMLDK
ncbi:MAG: Tm-1-like ATP-binding domain-containing protein [Oscillospiraceae bacterium]